MKVVLRVVRTVRYLLLVALISLVFRKIFLGHRAMRFVDQCSHQVAYERMINDQSFAAQIAQFHSDLPTLVLMLNRHALNMTLNWLCNTREMADVHRSALIVTLDEHSDRTLATLWPTVRRLRWSVPCLEDPFNYGDGRYQLFYLFRANFARAILHQRRPFWMIQQDTFWRKSLFDLSLDEGVETGDGGIFSDIMFDRAIDAHHGRLIAGGYYRVRPTNASAVFFERLARDIRWWYVPDNAYMTSLCADRTFPTRCGYIPFSAVTNWIWLYEPWRFPAYSRTPMLIQFDGDTKLGGKLEKMRTLGFYFLDQRDHLTCNGSAVAAAMARVKHSDAESARKYLEAGNSSGTSLSEDNSRWVIVPTYSYSHLQFGLYQSVIDQLYKTSVTEWLLNRIIFPFAHYFMITL